MSEPALVYSTYDAKARLSQLLDEVEEGNEVTITRHGKNIAKVIPFPKQKMPDRVLGRWAREGLDIVIPDDFDEFTAEDEEMWYGKALS